ncbi:hypothetical protein RHMOL_Rhmol06G0102700 [Rhododendron molle]|uniref:Uncharacterized protein n=1 Tax=Rhododendron molle TaxID=49168 RepID=A0ACC0NCT3_RHOML|nr:hypothetical protein RHMOL_Rhmol06G0102700 [Rhododendron molle]
MEVNLQSGTNLEGRADIVVDAINLQSSTSLEGRADIVVDALREEGNSSSTASASQVPCHPFSVSLSAVEIRVKVTDCLSSVDHIELPITQVTELQAKDGGNSMDVIPVPFVCPQEKDGPCILAGSESPAPVTPPPTPDRVDTVSGSRNLRSKRVVALWRHRVEDSEHLPILHSDLGMVKTDLGIYVCFDQEEEFNFTVSRCPVGNHDLTESSEGEIIGVGKSSGGGATTKAAAVEVFFVTNHWSSSFVEVFFVILV